MNSFPNSPIIENFKKMDKLLIREPLLDECENRFTLFPIKYSKIYEFFQTHEAGFWTTEEIDLKEDLTDWDNKLNENEKYFVSHILAFFAASDGIVNENLVLNFYQALEIPEARAYYTMQMLIETIHSQTYSVLIDTFIKDSQERENLFNAIHHVPVVQKKAHWALKWITTANEEKEKALEACKSGKIEDLEYLRDLLEKQNTKEYKTDIFIKQLLAFVIVEGLFFSGSFCSIFWLKNRGLMPGLCFSNELISRDEKIHADFGIYLYSLIKNKLSEEYVHKMFIEAVSIEKEFIIEALPVSLIGMNSEMMSKYIEYVADRILLDLGYSKLFNVRECPFKFMELLSFSGGNSKVNFFEKRNPDYQKSGIGKNSEEMNLLFEEEF